MHALVPRMPGAPVTVTSRFDRGVRHAKDYVNKPAFPQGATGGGAVQNLKV
jgi:hypothetical protein